MKNILKRTIANLSLRSKIISILLFLFLLTNVFFFTAEARYRNIYRDKLYQVIAEQLAYSGQKLSDTLHTMEEFINSQASDAGSPEKTENISNGADLDQILSDILSFDSRYDSSIYLLLDGSELLYQSSRLDEEAIKRIQELPPKDYQELYMQNHHYIVIRSKIPDYNWDYFCLVSYDSLFSDLQQSNTLLVCLFLSASLITLVLSIYMMGSVGRHFLLLKKKMLLATEDFSSVPPLEEEYAYRQDEIGVMHRQFSKMIDELGRLIQENYVHELQKKEAQLYALQSQINPHFLYNTLESINWRAHAVGATDISEMVQSLASLLRVTLRKEQTPLTLKQELELVENYMKIQRFRFEDRLKYSITVPDSLWNIFIPCLCLQPLAENAIRYGLEDSIDDCEIRIDGYEKNGWIHLIVRNTGSEFEEDLLRQLRREDLQPQGHGIGLVNIYERLRLTFGEKASLCLFNQDGWAIAEIIIPEEVAIC